MGAKDVRDLSPTNIKIELAKPKLGNRFRHFLKNIEIELVNGKKESIERKKLGEKYLKVLRVESRWLKQSKR